MVNAKPGKQINVTFNKSLFSWLDSPKVFMNVIKDYQRGEKQTLIVGMDLIEKYDSVSPYYGVSTAELVKTFLGAIYGKAYNSKHPVNKNIFTVTYDKDQPVFFGSPTICKHNKEVCLLLGGEISNTEYKFNTVPVDFTQSVPTLKGSSIESIQPSQIEINDLESSIPNAKKKLTIMCFTVGNVTFNLNLKLNENVDYMPLVTAWNKRDISLIENYVTGIYGYTSSFSYMFKEWFDNKIFPKNGIIIKIVGGKLIKGKDAKGKELQSVLFRLDTSELPPIDVLCTERGKKEMFPAPLNEVTGLFSGGTQKLAATFIDSHNGGGVYRIPTPDDPWFLHVVRQGKESKTVPVHELYDNDFVPGNVSKLLVSQKSELLLLGQSSDDDLNYDDNPL